MRRFRFVDGTWDGESKRSENYAPVRVEDIPEKWRARYRQQRRALELYLDGDVTVAEITTLTGVAPGRIYELSNEASVPRSDGMYTGWHACIPYFRKKKGSERYELRCAVGPKTKAGLLGRLFFEYPAIKERMDDLILGKAKLKLSFRRGKRYASLWAAFIELCRANDIDETQYPFTSKDRGYGALRRYAKRRLEGDFEAYARVMFGDDSGRLANRSAFGTTPDRGREPYASVAIDGHRIDALFTVRFVDQLGDEVELLLDRIWLLVAIDDASRAVLGYTLSLEANYTSEDVLRCIGSVFEPWQPMDLPDGSTRYAPGAGLPNAVVEGCAYRAFSTLTLDNAKSHMSEWMQTRVIDAGALEVVTTRPASPRSRNARVERFNRTYADYTSHELPSTTGSGPDDVRRRSPEAAARRYEVSLLDLERITSVAMANYNAMEHQSLNGRSPLDYLRMRAAKGRDVVRQTPERTLSGLGWYDRDFTCKVRASAKHGHWPHVNFQGARYYCDELRSRPDLVSQPVVLRLNVTDIRAGWLFHEGECIGRARVEGIWQERRHSLRTRRAILALRNRGVLARRDQDPVSGYLDHVERRSRKSPKAASKFVRVRSEVGETAPEKQPEPVTPRRDIPGLPGRANIRETFD